MKKLIHTSVIAFLSVPLAFAQLGGWQPGSSFDSSTAQSQKIMKLSEIKALLKSRYGGKMLDAKPPKGSVYDISWETGKGRKLNLKVDAKTGRVLSES